MSADYGQWLLRSGSKDLSGYLYGTWDFGNGVQAWTNLAVFDSEAQWGTSPPYVQLPAGLEFPAFYDTTSGQQLIGVRQFTANEVGSQAGLRNRNRERSWDISAGLRGTLADGRFDWEASLGRLYYRVQERISTVNWQRANAYVLGPQQGTVDGLPAYALDRVRWWTPLTPGQYAQIGAHSVNRAASWVNQGALSLSGRLFEGWAGPIEFAAVVEAAQQGYRLNPDPRANLDYEVQNVDRGGGERTRYSGGLEFSVPLTTTLTATLAGRYDRYGDYEAFNDDANLLDIGTQKESTWSAGLQWRPIDSLLLHGDRVGAMPGVRSHWGLDRLDKPGGCVPFADGGVPDDRANCTDTDPASPTFGQSTRKYFGRIGLAITWNVNLGYRITPAMKLNLYVNNVFNSTGYNHKDPYKLDYEFYNSRLFSPVGREIAAEYVFDF
ncbi:TonB-dependent receptor [Xanthomonas campestris pv. asclepiadis]|nr:TonB-dependent receptor [Xanthomonas campestris pv. asclepiadis]